MVKFMPSDAVRHQSGTVPQHTDTASPLITQRAIADYLDAETARIDALIEKKRRMVELLEERHLRCAIVDQVLRYVLQRCHSANDRLHPDGHVG